MVTALRQAFAAAEKLPEAEQEQLAERMLAEAAFDAKLEASGHPLATPDVQ